MHAHEAGRDDDAAERRRKDQDAEVFVRAPVSQFAAVVSATVLVLFVMIGVCLWVPMLWPLDERQSLWWWPWATAFLALWVGLLAFRLRWLRPLACLLIATTVFGYARALW